MMKASTLVDVFEGRTLISVLKREISNEVEIFRNGLKKTGGSTPIYVKSDTDQFLIEPKNVRRLCEAFLKGQLDEIELPYILTGLELSQCFEFSSDSLVQIVARLSDLAEFPPTHDFVREELRSFQT